MSKIDFFSLGGLDEKQKSCSVLIVDDDIYVLNMGIAVPASVTLGIKKKIPDFSWLINNKNKIKGIFIGTPSYENFGALEFFNKYLSNIPIYTNNIGNVVIKTYFEKRTDTLNSKLNIRILQSLKQEKIGNAFVTPFRITNSLPSSLGFVFTTKDGSIVYIDDFVINSSKNLAFQDSILELNKQLNNVLLLIIGTGNSQNQGFTSPNFRAINFFENVITDNDGRIFFLCFDNNAFNVFTIASIASRKQRPFVIYSNTFEILFNSSLRNNLIKFNNLLYIDPNSINQSKNAIVVITGTPERLFAKVNKILANEDDKIFINENDAFVFAEKTIPGYEVYEARLMDDLARHNIKSYKLPKNILPMKASSEDHKLLIKLINPKYIIPINGLYKDLVDYAKNAIIAGIDKNNIEILDNGEIISFINSNKSSNKKTIQLVEQYIDTQGVLDVNASSLFERNQMGENGVVLVNLLISKSKQKILKQNFDVIGVTMLDENNLTIIRQMNEDMVISINNLLGDFFKNSKSEIKELKNSIKKIVVKQYDKKFNKKPLVLPTIIIKK